MLTLNQTFDEYRAVKALNASTAVHGLSSFRKMRWQMENEQEATSSLQLGTAVHSMLELTPDTFAEAYVVMPDFHLMEGNCTDKGDPSASRATKWVKQAVAKWREEEEAGLNREVLTPEVYLKAIGMLQALHSHTYCREVIMNSHKEITATAEFHGVPVKGRIDLYDNQNGILADVKTTNDVDPVAFGRTFCRFHYAFKMRWYQRLMEANGRKVNEVLLVLVESTPWADRYVQPIPEIVLEQQDSKIDRVILGYKECMETGVWPGMFEDECPELCLPYSAMQESEDELLDWGDLA